MRNILLLLTICSIVLAAIYFGSTTGPAPDPQQSAEPSVSSRRPTSGRIEVLNGCGITGAAGAVADFLRDKGFDVKNIDNAPSWNYPQTIVVSRIRDVTVAEQVCTALHIENLICLRTGEEQYNVSIFVGSDFGELIE
jgi:hypothetical protein